VYAESFESVDLTVERFDVVISNVSFGNYKIYDRAVRGRLTGLSNSYRCLPARRARFLLQKPLLK